MRDSPPKEKEAAILERYDALCFSGAQTIEKHVRWIAEQFVEALDGGFTDLGPRWKTVAFRVEGVSCEVLLFAPAGCHGFALQLVVEEQLRAGLEASGPLALPREQSQPQGWRRVGGRCEPPPPGGIPLGAGIGPDRSASKAPPHGKSREGG